MLILVDELSQRGKHDVLSAGQSFDEPTLVSRRGVGDVSLHFNCFVALFANDIDVSEALVDSQFTDFMLVTSFDGLA